MRILYSSNAFWAASGYGVQGRSLLPRLANLPVVGGRQNVAMFAWYGLQGGIHEVNGFRVYPMGLDQYGNDVIGPYTRHFGADIVITLIDVWVLKKTAERIAPARWLPWLPIDADPIPQLVLDSLEGAHLPLTYSRWGHRMLSDAGIDNHYIPHGIETDVYRVNPDIDAVRAFRRDALGNPSHLSVMVAANKGVPDRKWFQGQLRAWARFAADKPGAKLYLHTDIRPVAGVDLLALANHLGIADRLLVPDAQSYHLGMPAEHLAMIYNNADAFLGAAMSEGFGIPLIEAQACGAPVVTTDFSAMPELVRWGMAVPPADRFYNGLNSWWAWPDVNGVHAALECLYAEWHTNGDCWPMEQRERASQAIHEEYSWDVIVRDQWAPLMARLAGETAVPAHGNGYGGDSVLIPEAVPA